MSHLVRTLLTVIVALAAIAMLLNTTHPDQAMSVSSTPAADTFVFLPLINKPVPPPAGPYNCDEYEFGLIWAEEAITLNADGSSIYAYHLPSSVVTGTWVYTPTTQEVGFTNYQWITATFYPPDRLWASKYLTHAGFEIAVNCHKLQ